jgi:hypothetical protein
MIVFLGYSARTVESFLIADLSGRRSLGEDDRLYRCSFIRLVAKAAPAGDTAQMSLVAAQAVHLTRSAKIPAA